jgi:hypothetical protein
MQNTIMKSLATSGVPDSAGLNAGGRVVPGEGPLGLRRIGDGGPSSFDTNEINTVLPFMLMNWDDNHEAMLRTGGLLFVCRHALGKRVCGVELYKLNEILRQGARLHRESFEGSHLGSFSRHPKAQGLVLGQIDNDPKNPGLMETSLPQDVRRLRKKILATKSVLVPSSEQVAFFYSDAHHRMNVQAIDKQLEEELNAINSFKRSYGDLGKDSEIMRMFFGVDEEQDTLFKELLLLKVENRDTISRYASVQSIRRFWNYLGIVNNTNEGKAMQTLPTLMPNTGNAAHPGKVANVVIHKKAVTQNRWGDAVNHNARLYLVLTREIIGKDENGDDVYDDYQIIPWFSNKQGEKPPASLLLHKDYEGLSAIGHWWYVGKVDHKNAGKVADNVRRAACGLRPIGGSEYPSVRAAFEQLAKLETLEMTSKILQ